MKTGAIKIAPIYDLGGSFGSGVTAKQYLENPNKTTLLLLYFLYGDLDPDWDYSWYKKNRLTGFENDIKSVLSLSDFYKPHIIDFIIAIYHQQKSFLDKMSEKTKE